MNPSPSTMGRAAACPASCALPRAESSSEAAEDGKAIHAYLARVAVSPATKSVALSEVPERLRARCAAIDVAAALDGLTDIVAETAYLYDVMTGAVRHVGINEGRPTGERGPNEIACILDVLAKRGDRWVVKDWKSGQDVGDVAANWQMKILGLVVRAAFGADEVDAEITYVDEAGATRTAAHTFDGFGLDDAEREVQETVKRVRAAEAAVVEGKLPVLSEGEHCRYCPSFSFCPAKNQLARSMVRDVETLMGAVEAMSPAEQGAAWVKLKAFFAIGRKVEDAIKEAAARGGVPLPNGKVLRMVPGSRETVDGKRALSMLRELGVDSAILGELVRSTAYEQVREVKP